MLVLQKLAVERGFPPPPPMRPPFEAEIDFEGIRSAEAPCWSSPGTTTPGGSAPATRWRSGWGRSARRIGGSGHAPQRANGFNEGFEEFLTLP